MIRCTNGESQGTKYGRWTVIGYGGQAAKQRKAMIECVCECGERALVSKTNLVTGKSKSCGCLKRDLASTRARQREPYYAAMHNQYVNYRYGAAKRSLPFDIEESVFCNVAAGCCSYCGAPPTEHKRNLSGTDYFANGVDRIDSELGYVEGNIVPCCWRCNKSKSKMSRDQFVQMCKEVAAHNKDL